LEVSRRGDYEWLRRPPRAEVDADQPGRDNVPRDFVQGRGTYGTRRIGRVLAQAGLRGKTRRQFKAPRGSEQAQTIAPNQLKRELTVHIPDTVSVGAMTDLPTGEGWLSLAVVPDLGSRAVGGWSMADHRRTELVTQALARALDQRQPAAGLIRHTDRSRQ
jgi:transposase InsO family protein